MRGKFIVLEGMDGVGKTTQLKLLSYRLSKLSIPHYVTSECTNGPIGKLIREEFLSGKQKIDQDALDMLFTADRIQHIKDEENGILNKIENGITVLCDRYYLSTMAYSDNAFIGDHEKHMNDICVLNKFAMKNMKPDITLCLDIGFTDAMKNIRKRNNKIEIYDKEETLKKLAISYASSIWYLKKSYNENIEIVDGSDTIEKVSDKIWNKVYPIIKDIIKEGYNVEQ